MNALVRISALVALWAPMASSAQPDTLVVPFAAGSGTNGGVRTVGKKLSERLRQLVLVDNKPGASAQIEAVHVAMSKPDGCTLLIRQPGIQPA